MSICHSIKQSYDSLKKQKESFVSSCNEMKGHGTFDTLTRPQLNTLKRLKLKLETARNELKEKINIVFRVSDAKNPYREAMLASGIPDIDQNQLSAERRDMTWNLKETIKDNQATYRSMGLTAWAENIATMRLHITPEMRQTIEQEIKDGAIPIIMPDRETQLVTTVEQFKTSFKPTWIKDGEEQEVNDAYLYWGYFTNLITNKAEELVEGVPDHPYISMMKPTQKPDERTCDKDAGDQRLEFMVISNERAAAHQENAHVVNPHEYGALQIISSRLFKEKLPSALTTLNPIDTDTWTRFINMSSCSVEPIEIPSAFFRPYDPRMGFDRTDVHRSDAWCGFRLAVRVPL